MWRVQVAAALTFFCFVFIFEINACDETGDIFPCTCAVIDETVVVNCSGNRLRTVPENLPKNMAVLDFSDNLLQSDNLDSLCYYDYLTDVSIAFNHLITIEPKRLTKCHIPKSLVLNGNSLNVVDKYTLYGLEFTEVIYGYEAREFRENTFSDMFKLRKLEMITHQNKIPASLFKKTHIADLKMNINGAMEIPKILLSPLNKTLTKLTIRSDSLQALPGELLSNLKVLEQFSLQVNHLHSLPSTLFQEGALYGTVTSISLSGIKSLPRHVFWLLGRLRHLEIHGTVDMPADMFSGLHGLEYLDLSECSITTIPDKWFNDLWQSITPIQDKWFDGLWHVRTLNMHNVGLTTISKADFQDLHALEKLDLSNNKLRTLDSMLFHCISGSAKFINISGNILKKVPNDLFKQNATLERLDISRNHIYTIESEAFIHLSELKRLYLQSNKLNKINTATFVYNVNMTYLDISSNILNDLPVGLLGSTHSLLVFNLSDNLIINLGRSITLYAPTLRELNVAFNPIECDCGIITVKKLLPNALIIGDCDNTQREIAIVDFPDVNCSAKKEAAWLITRSVLSTKQIYSTENQIKRETKIIINTNNTVSTIRQLNSIILTATQDIPSFTENDLSALMINSTQSKKSSETIKVNVLPIIKYSDSEYNATIISINGNFTPTSVRDTSVPLIKKSASVTLNKSRAELDDNTVEISANIISTDHLNTVSINFTKTVESLAIKTVDVSVRSSIRNEISPAFTTSKPEPEINEGITPDIARDTTLEPSFKPPNSTPKRNYFVTGYLSENLQTKTVISENGSDKSEIVGLISPTSVYRIETNDGQTMTDGFRNSNVTFEYSPNATALLPEVGYGNITSKQEMDEMEDRSDYFYWSLGSIISVAVFSVLILVFLYIKRRRSDEFVIGTRRSANIYDIEDSFNEDDLVSPRESLCPMKEVPSIQIETVDDDGNVKLEYYIGPKSIFGSV